MISGKMPRTASVLLFLLILFLSLQLASAHEEDAAGHEDGNASLELQLQKATLAVVYSAAAAIAVIVLITALNKKTVERKNSWKIALFSIIAAVVAAATIFTAGATIYLNAVSHTGGPVHWHADFEVWNCGEKLNLKDPAGLANRVGSSAFHEHGDDRIHMEGVVTDLHEASLHTFFHLIGAELTQGFLRYNTNETEVSVRDGDMCNGREGKLQVFVYKVKNPEDMEEWKYEQVKLDNYGDYVLSPHANVPPGDCIIIEFDTEKGSTDKVCETYRIAMEKGELSGG